MQKSWLRMALRVLGLALHSLFWFLPVLLLWCLTLERQRAHLVSFYYDVCRRIAGVKLKVEGKQSPRRPLMLVANHSSYLDILVIGSLTPVSFTPKREIRKWPVIGFFCVLADCVFIERRPAAMEEAKQEMEEKLRQKKVISLFPEGTTGDGFHIKPFKSGFLKLVEDHDLPVQPLSIAYTHIGTVPLNAGNRDHVAWIGEASFVTHFCRLMRYRSVSVTVTYYEIQRRSHFENRKELARACEVIITEGLHRTLEANGVTA